jgi:hypothetical protein
MHINALQATEASRVKFFEALKENLWIRMHAVYTTWCCRYSRDVLDVPDQVMTEVKALAAESGVTGFHAVAQCGNDQPFWFEHKAEIQPEARHL